MFNQLFSKPLSRTSSGQSLKQSHVIPIKTGTKAKPNGSHSPDRQIGQPDYFLLKQTGSPYQLAMKSPGPEIYSKGLQHNGQGASYAMGPRRMSSNLDEKSTNSLKNVFARQPSLGSIQTPRAFKPNIMNKMKKEQEQKPKRQEEEVYDSFTENRGPQGKLINHIPAMNISHEKFLSKNPANQSRNSQDGIQNSTLNNTMTGTGPKESTETGGKPMKFFQMPKKTLGSPLVSSGQMSPRTTTASKLLMQSKEEKGKVSKISINEGSKQLKAEKFFPSRRPSTQTQTRPGSPPEGKQSKGELGRQDCVWADTEFLMNAKFNNTSKCIALLTQSPKPSLTAADNEGWTPLHYAVWHNNLKFINILLLNSANPNTKTKDNVTPLMLAAKM